jgi:hypothetical protein
MNIIKDISNIPGKKTKRKIVVIESDDWGSIRMPSVSVYQDLLKKGSPVDKSHFNKYDALECNDDLEILYSVLQKYHDCKQNNPVFTCVNIVANPDFDKIEKNGFEEYYYEPFAKTLDGYPNHDRVYSLWKEGVQNGLVYPVFHGREHLNVIRWMSELRNGNDIVRFAFNRHTSGIPRSYRGGLLPDFQAAFDIDHLSDNTFMSSVLESGLDLFEQLYGYRSRYFVPTNGPFCNVLEKTLFNGGVSYINSGKIQHEPIGNGQTKVHFRYMGKRNKFNQCYITRNCFFEPSSSNVDYVDLCLRDISTAFKWHKPAVISTHRVNYIGFLHEENRDKSIKQLEKLLSRMLEIWPDIEFISSVELGDMLIGDK